LAGTASGPHGHPLLGKGNCLDARQCLRNIRIIRFAFLGIPAFLFFPLSTLHFSAQERIDIPADGACSTRRERSGIATTFRGELIRPAVEKTATRAARVRIAGAMEARKHAELVFF
jgi:hypothetical protein